MATVIDELTVILNLDPKKFTDAQKTAVAAMRTLEEQSVKSGKETEAQSKKMLDFFSNLKREALGFLAAFYGGKGIKDVIGHLTTMDASVARLGGTIKTAPEVLAKWRIAMTTVGGTAQDADSAIQGLSDTMQDFLRNPGSPPMGLLNVAKQIGFTGDLTDPTAFLTALAKYGQTVPKEQFAAVARDVPGMNQQMIYLLLELNKRLTAAEKVTPKGGGLGEFSEEYIASIALFDAAANNLARVILDKFVPAINSFTGLFTQWLAQPGSPEAKAAEEKLNKDIVKKLPNKKSASALLHGDPVALATGFANWIDYGLWGLPTPGNPAGTSPKGKGNPFGSGETLMPTGAKGSAAVSNVSNSRTRSSNTNTEVNIGTVNLPNVTDAPGFVSGIKKKYTEPYVSPGASMNSAY